MELKRKKVKLVSYCNEFLLLPTIYNGKKYWFEWVTVSYYYSIVFHRYCRDEIVALGKQANRFNKNSTEMVYKDSGVKEYLSGEQQ